MQRLTILAVVSLVMLACDEPPKDNCNGLFTYTYDTNGYLTTIDLDYFADGTVEERTTYTNDDHGNPLTEELDLGIDGTIEMAFAYTYEYGSDDEVSVLTIESDVDGDGAIDKTQTYIFHGQSDLPAQSCEGEGCFVSVYEYGSSQWVECDAFIETKVYDETTDLLTTEELDLGADETLDQRITHTYGADEMPLTWDLDEGCDETVDVHADYDYTYDDQDNLLVVEKAIDGWVQVVEVTTYTYDEDGNRLTMEWDDGDGWLDRRWTWTYFPGGGMKTWKSEQYYDHELSSVYLQTFRPDGQILSDEEDHDADETMDSWTTYEYDASDNLVLETHERIEDGDVDVWFTVAYTYDADGNRLTEFYEESEPLVPGGFCIWM